jgi:pSer/pThr/pTyr-binding forkhead associated (FHA) protein
MSAVCMRPVVIQIERTKERTAETCAFAQSPVRIGRNPLNDIELDDGYVSQWHGVLRFDADQISYLDLGSTNPTMVDGKPVDRNKEVTISETTDLRIGQYRLHVLRVDEAPPDLFGARRKTAFARTGMGDASSVATTMYLPEPTKAHSRSELAAMLNAAGGDLSAWAGPPPVNTPSAPVFVPPSSLPPPLPNRTGPPAPHVSAPPPPPPATHPPPRAPTSSLPPRPSQGPGGSSSRGMTQSMQVPTTSAVSIAPIAIGGPSASPRPSIGALNPSAGGALNPSAGGALNPSVAPPAVHPKPSLPPRPPEHLARAPEHLARAGSPDEALRDAYGAYRQSWRELLAQLRARLQQTPPERRIELLDALVYEYPHLGHEADFRALLPEMGVSPLRTGVPEMEDWLRRLTDNMFPPPNVAINVALAMERIGEVLEVFSTAFVELRDAHGRFCDEMSLERPPSDSILQTTKNPRVALAYLLNPSTEGSSKVEELARSMADFALHQVALVSAVVEGARGILQDISPEAAGKRDPNGPKPGLFARMFSNEVQVQWDRYRGLFAEMVDEDRFTRRLFGRAFARKYYAIMGGRRSLTPSRS